MSRQAREQALLRDPMAASLAAGIHLPRDA